MATKELTIPANLDINDIKPEKLDDFLGALTKAGYYPSDYIEYHKGKIYSLCFEEDNLQAAGTCIPGDLGRIYGPPEDCYPPEAPEVEDLKVTIKEVEITDLLTDKCLETLKESLLEEAGKQEQDDRDYHEEMKAEAAMEAAEAKTKRY